MASVVGAFLRREEIDGGRDQRADLLVGAGTSGAQERFQFGERELDGIEVWTVGRKKSKVRACLLDGRPDGRLFVGREIVHHDDIARPERRHQDLLDIGEEARTVDGPIEHGRRTQALHAQRGNDSVRFPVTTGRVVADSGAARTAAVAPQQISGDAALVEKDVPTEIPEALPLAPVAPLNDDVGTPLFVGVYGFF